MITGFCLKLKFIVNKIVDYLFLLFIKSAKFVEIP